MTSYTVIERNGCRLVQGQVPLRAMGSLMGAMPRKAVMDLHAARVLGVTFAMGLPEDLAALCGEPDVVDEAYRRARQIGQGLPEDAIRWLAIGRQRSSSQTIFQRLTGRRLTDRETHPCDPSDFGRCRLMLEEVSSLRGRMAEVAAISEIWARIVSAWEDLCAEMDREAPNWRDGVGFSPSTYARMKALGC